MLWPRSYDGLIWAVQKIMKTCHETIHLFWCFWARRVWICLCSTLPSRHWVHPTSHVSQREVTKCKGKEVTEWPPEIVHLLECYYQVLKKRVFFVGCLAWNLTVCCLYLTVQALPDLHKDFFDTIRKLFEIDIDRKKATWLNMVHAACFMILCCPSRSKTAGPTT